MGVKRFEAAVPTAQDTQLATAWVLCGGLSDQVLLSKELNFLERNLALKLTERTVELRAMLASLHRWLLRSPTDLDLTQPASDS
jgi:hypothetical protein